MRSILTPNPSPKERGYKLILTEKLSVNCLPSPSERGDVQRTEGWGHLLRKTEEMYDFKDRLDASDIEALDKLYRVGSGISVYQHPLWPDALQTNQRTRFFLQKENDTILLSAKIIESHLTKAPIVKYAHVRGGFLYNDAALLFPAVKEI